MVVRAATPQEARVEVVRVTPEATQEVSMVWLAMMVLAVCSSSSAKVQCRVQEQSRQTVLTVLVRQEPLREVRRAAGP